MYPFPNMILLTQDRIKWVPKIKPKTHPKKIIKKIKEGPLLSVEKPEKLIQILITCILFSKYDFVNSI